MDIKETNRIMLNKNRGWRGLAELRCLNETGTNLIHRMIFSFSQEVWDDMQKGYIVTQDEQYYYIIQFAHPEELPKGQRSVLIKYFIADVIGMTRYKKDEPISDIPIPKDKDLVRHFLTNDNNHTTSDWNYIGVRVTPVI